ncbi:hypothetical protein ACL2XO_19885 [Sodalis sp. RH15]|uniref:hypothetical protein n=1 Tax=Sodalis sp. RH15 TaxID=3394330 RepID=UPI0039B60972
MRAKNGIKAFLAKSCEGFVMPLRYQSLCRFLIKIYRALIDSATRTINSLINFIHRNNCPLKYKAEPTKSVMQGAKI